MMLAGFTSRWLTPERCARSSASAICGVLQRLIQWQRAFGDARRERFAFQMLQHHEADAVLIADIVKHADIRMIESGNGAGLAFEPGAQFGPLGDVLRHHLDGDRAVETVETRVARLPHLAHPACADLR
jgi:hypothetical protein